MAANPNNEFYNPSKVRAYSGIRRTHTHARTHARTHPPPTHTQASSNPTFMMVPAIVIMFHDRPQCSINSNMVLWVS